MIGSHAVFSGGKLMFHLTAGHRRRLAVIGIDLIQLNVQLNDRSEQPAAEAAALDAQTHQATPVCRAELAHWPDDGLIAPRLIKTWCYPDSDQSADPEG